MPKDTHNHHHDIYLERANTQSRMHAYTHIFMLKKSTQNECNACLSIDQLLQYFVHRSQQLIYFKFSLIRIVKTERLTMKSQRNASAV